MRSIRELLPIFTVGTFIDHLPRSQQSSTLPLSSSALQVEATTLLKSILEPPTHPSPEKPKTPVQPRSAKPTQPLFLPSPTPSISNSRHKNTSVPLERNSSRPGASRTKDPKSRHSSIILEFSPLFCISFGSLLFYGDVLFEAAC